MGVVFSGCEWICECVFLSQDIILIFFQPIIWPRLSLGNFSISLLHIFTPWGFKLIKFSNSIQNFLEILSFFSSIFWSKKNNLFNFYYKMACDDMCVLMDLFFYYTIHLPTCFQEFKSSMLHAIQLFLVLNARNISIFVWIFFVFEEKGCAFCCCVFLLFDLNFKFFFHFYFRVSFLIFLNIHFLIYSNLFNCFQLFIYYNICMHTYNSQDTKETFVLLFIEYNCKWKFHCKSLSFKLLSLFFKCLNLR